MPATVKSSPFNSSNWSDTWYNALDNNIRTGAGAGSYWDMGGWHFKRRAGWAKQPTKGHRVSRETLWNHEGKKVKVYKAEGYDDYMAFYPHNDAQGSSNQEDAIVYAEAAFSEEANDNVIEIEGCGHIASLKWAQRHQVMDVKFADGAECYFFRVPSAVFGTLRHFAVSKQFMPGSNEHHMLGHMFWELVRIKGQQHGARYPFEYVTHSSYQLTGSNKRHFVRLTPENYEAITGKHLGNVQLGDMISTILTEEQWLSLPDDVKMNSIAAAGKDAKKVEYEKENGEKLNPDLSSTKYLENEAKNKAWADFKTSIDNLQAALKKGIITQDRYDDEIQALMSDPEYVSYGFDKTRPEGAVKQPVNHTGMLTENEAAKLKQIYNDFNAAEEARIAKAQKNALKAITHVKQNPANADTLAALESMYKREPELARAIQKLAGVDYMFKALGYTDPRNDPRGWQHPTDWVFKREFSQPRLEPDLEYFEKVSDNPEAAYREFKELRRRRDRARATALGSNAHSLVGKPWNPEKLQSLAGTVDSFYDNCLAAKDYAQALNHLKDVSGRIYKRSKFGQVTPVESPHRIAGPNDFLSTEYEMDVEN